MRPTILLELSPRILFTIHQLLPCLVLLFSSLQGNYKGLQLGQRGNNKMGRVSMLSCLFLKWDPSPLFYRQKQIVMVGVTGYGWSTGQVMAQKPVFLCNFIFHSFCECTWVVVVQQACVHGNQWCSAHTPSKKWFFRRVVQ